MIENYIMNHGGQWDVVIMSINHLITADYLNLTSFFLK